MEGRTAAVGAFREEGMDEGRDVGKKGVLTGWKGEKPAANKLGNGTNGEGGGI
jgi:hypothetical protein